jgi:hypothetical protein
LPKDGIHLSAFDAWSVIACVIIATAMMALRRLRKVEHRPRQWLDDALNTGTLIVLGALVASSFPWWAVPFAASPLTDIALVYCAGLILLAMYRSVLTSTAKL